MEKERDATGTTLRFRQTGAGDDIVCHRPLPRGVSKGDAWNVLYFDQVSDNRVDDEYHLDDDHCAPIDAQVGVTLGVKLSDAAGLGALIRWTAPPSP